MLNKYKLGDSIIETTEVRYNNKFRDMGYIPYEEPKKEQLEEEQEEEINEENSDKEQLEEENQPINEKKSDKTPKKDNK